MGDSVTTSFFAVFEFFLSNIFSSLSDQLVSVKLNFGRQLSGLHYPRSVGYFVISGSSGGGRNCRLFDNGQYCTMQYFLHSNGKRSNTPELCYEIIS